MLNGRNEFTSRWVEYAKAYDLPYKVLVADGAEDESARYILEKSFINSSAEFQYIKYPPDKSLRIFYSKIQNALKRVETPYVVFASNDDFYFFDSLEKSAKFLNHNADYVASRGEIWDFNVLDCTRTTGAQKGNIIYGHIGGISKLYEHPTVLGECALERTLDFSHKSNSTWHDVVRTKVILGAYDQLLKTDIEDIIFADNLVCFYLACHGKIHRGDSLYMLHQCHEDTAALTLLYASPCDWMKSSRWNLEFKQFIDSIALVISNIDKTIFADSKLTFSNNYYQQVLLSSMMDYTKKLENKLANSINEKVDYSLVSFIKFLIKKNHSLYAFFKNISSSFGKNLGNEADLNVPVEFKSKIDSIQKFLLSHE